MRKAQSQIITTILIILLVLAAIVIVWQVVRGTVEEGAESIPGQTDCLTTRLDISVPATNAQVLKVERGTGEGDLVGIRVFINDVAQSPDVALSINELEGKDTTYSILAADQNKTIKIAKLVGEDVANARLCEFADNSVDGIVIA